MSPGTCDLCIYMSMTSYPSTASNDFGHSVVVHTSVPFGVQHLEKEKDAVQNIILEELEKVMPGLPQPDSIKCQKWRYSQVRQHSGKAQMMLGIDL